MTNPHDLHAAAVDVAIQNYTDLQAKIQACIEEADQCIASAISAVGESGGPAVADEIRGMARQMADSSNGSLAEAIGYAGSIIEKLGQYMEPWA